MKETHTGRVDCLKCVHFAVTWEPRLPKACQLFGFKSATLPSLAVYQSTGTACMGFVKKDGQKKEAHR